ncbi:MAG: SufS family cysteine desulfurase [Bacteroidota bacterium]
MHATPPTHLWDVNTIRAQFPALSQQIHGKPLNYVDNASTMQKPQVVLEALRNYYLSSNANVHRATHALADQATEALEATRKHVQHFIHAAEPEEIIFTAGTTASINLVAQSYGRAFLQKDDEVIISHMEHHANLVPWQMLCEERGAQLQVIPITDAGELCMEAFDNLLTSRTRIVAITYVSNTLGTINPIQEIVTKAHAVGAVVLVDAAQAISHLRVDVQELGCDFLAFSAHKAYGPTGVGVLYGKRPWLESMPPYQGGGEMIQEVTLEKTSYNALPYKFEAGTPHIAGIVGLDAALTWLEEIGLSAIKAHEAALLTYAHHQLRPWAEQIQYIGQAPDKVGILAFHIPGIHHADIGMLLDAQGIAVRTGHACTQPLMQRFGIEGVVRASFAMYNTLPEVEQLVAVVARLLDRKRSAPPTG